MHTLDKILAANSSTDPHFYKRQVPAYLYSNLKEGFGQRLYQQEAFGRFVYYWNHYTGQAENLPVHLLYHMATGSGKTLIMAGLMIYLYTKGYRHFLFFVNSANIIDKTRDNFLNTASSKYLFSERISIGDKQIKITEADNFQSTHPDNINIVFSTIQGLHSRLNTPRENSLTYDDFESNKIVLISDEAHHINADTKRSTFLKHNDKERIISWESTVNRLFNANRGNVLLEFTATSDFSVPDIKKKYYDKLIFDYPLRQFCRDKYSKDVKVLQSNQPPFERALNGILLSQYRKKVFEKYKILIKPVLLFKSKTIKESRAFHDEFITGMRNLDVSHLEKIKNSHPAEAIRKVFQYLKTNHISLENFIIELKEDFSEEKLISVNSKDESEQKQLTVNSLEDETNVYRAVFAVDKLNEGWDVLNLFDIVRLYDTKTRNRSRQPDKTAMSEAQLIGRGSRYCPFKLTERQPAFKRKYDEEECHELRIGEELYYHSTYNPKYIQELNTALEKIGIKDSKKIKKPEQPKKESRKPDKQKEGKNLPGRSLIERIPLQKITLKNSYYPSASLLNNRESVPVKKRREMYSLADLGIPVLRKAINKLEFYRFSNLKIYFPGLHSVSEFITSNQYAGQITLEVTGPPKQIETLSPKEKLDIAVCVLDHISQTIRSDKSGREE